ncbi:MAG TPA: class I SAM-dependent methyltransferase [Niastella sp.]
MSYLRRPSKRRLIKYSWQLTGKNGLEIGGPSSFFSVKGNFPVYLFANRIDGVNFNTETIWEGSIKEGGAYRFYKKEGYQYIREATDLQGIENNKYDFLLSCHSLEHVANPLKALSEWQRVLQPGGILVLVLPDKRYTFDINRTYTTMDHLVKDYDLEINEKDTTHFDEIKASYGPGIYPGIGSQEELVQRLANNYTTRFAHHHVFNFNVMEKMLNYFDFKVLHQQQIAPFHLTMIAQKALS